jgi:Tfp pilus assembly protein PilN
MPKTGGYRVSVFLSEDVLKIAEVNVGKKIQVTRVFSQSLRDVPASEWSRIIKSGLKGFRVKGSRLVGVISASMASTKNIEVPSTDDEEIRSIVNLQAGRHTPFSRDEIQIGFVNLGVVKTSYTSVLLVIANRHKIKQQLDALMKAGIQTSQVVFAPEGMAAFYAGVTPTGDSNKPFALFDIDQRQTDVMVVSAGLPIATRSIPIGKEMLSADVGGLVDELKKTFDSYQHEDVGLLPEQFLMTAQGEITGSVQSVLQANFKWFVQVSDLFDHVKCSKSVMKAISGPYSQVSFADVICAGATAHQLQVNLLPEEIIIQKTVQDQGRQLFTAAVLGITVLFFIGAGLGSQVFFKRVFYQRLVDNYQSVHEEAESLMRDQRKTQIVKNYMNGRMMALDTLYEFFQYLPPSIYLTGVMFEQDGTVSIQGVSESGSEVYNFGSTLEGIELFKKAQVKSTNARKDRGKDATAFEIVITLVSAENDMDTQ